MRMQRKLRELGFTNVLGAIECVGAGNRRRIGKGQCGNCFDTHHGLTVVYDEGHEPWLRAGHITADELAQLGLGPEDRGAYVPLVHTGDEDDVPTAQMGEVTPVSPSFISTSGLPS